jgi:hypothetical protein
MSDTEPSDVDKVQASVRNPLPLARSGFVADGYQRVTAGMEAEVRREIELKHANQCNTASLIRRWFLRRRVEREIRRCVAERSAHRSESSLF